MVPIFFHFRGVEAVASQIPSNSLVYNSGNLYYGKLPRRALCVIVPQVRKSLIEYYF